MRNVAEKSEFVSSEFPATRRRPDKALRHESRFAGNLSVFGQIRPSQIPASPSTHGFAESPDKTRKTAEYATLGAQPFAQVAANSDSAFTMPAHLQGKATKQQLAIAIASCLSLGAVVGYNWGLFVSQPTVELALTNPALTTSTVADIPAIIPSPVVQVEPEPLEIASFIDTRDIEAEYLDEIDWLQSQNSALQLDVDVLTQESIDLNYELLQLELQVVALQSESEPSTETRVVYNFVNVPIGSAIETLDNLPTNEPYTDDTFVEDNGYVDDYSYANDDSFLDDNTYVDENYVDEESREYLLAQDNLEYPVDSEISYDPETGFFINPQYVSDETQFAIDANEQLSYPPITSELQQ